ncbi:type II toxin-antitoxin system RelE/ParE family toxin [Arthrobacter sp. TWP1-1]|uniref:type II toxin-antitoxin system RelE/ParE family toxin n=1 Tax=Arthrobacter sp. TWP1-1 TaxID=2804568 RepID=UPI003CF318EF
MTGYRLTWAVLSNLLSIWVYIEERCDTLQADTYVNEIREAIARIADNPSPWSCRGSEEVDMYRNVVEFRFNL